MTLKEMMEKVVKEKNPIMAAKVVDFCWMKLGWPHQKIFEEVNKITGIEMPEWDALLYEADRELSAG